MSPASRKTVAGAIMQATGCAFNKRHAEAWKAVSTMGLLRPCLRTECERYEKDTPGQLACLRGLPETILARMFCDLDPQLTATDAL